MGMDPQAAMRAAIAVPGVPRDADGPVFREPWEAQAFAMTLALHERGVFTWTEWAAALAAEIKRAQAAGDPDTGETYYLHWLNTLEKTGRRKRRDDTGHTASLSRCLGPRLRPHAARRADRIAERGFQQLNTHQPLAHHVTGEQRRAEHDDHKRGRGFHAAYEDHSGARLCFCKPAGEPARADRKRGDGRNRDRRAEPHQECRRYADPEQPLRQRKHQHDDRARTGPQTDGDNRREAVAEPMLSGQFTRLRRVSMSPGRGLVSMVVMMIMAVRMAVMVMAVIVRMVVR